MKKYVFGIDIGGTTVKCGLFKTDGTILEKWEITTVLGSILEDVAKTIEEKMAEKNIAKNDVSGVGIGVPGPVTSEGYVVVGVNVGWPDGKDVKGELEGMLSLPVAVGNDANVAALGELWLGSAQGAQNAIMYTLGTGVGGGVIIDGKVVAGPNGAGGELGHSLAVLNGSACNCGKNGCLETVASATGIVRETVNYLASTDTPSPLRDLEKIEAKDVFEAAKAGDTISLKMVDQLGFYLGLNMANVAAAVDPEKIIVGGGVSKAGDFLIDAIAKHYREFAFSSVRNAEFVIATRGNDAGIMGAAYMVMTAS
ncbi:MAG: ROK family glucokinase [Turicibacter sp.]|nr:ROK family glucokinase [Turicibacter sp.]